MLRVLFALLVSYGLMAGGLTHDQIIDLVKAGKTEADITAMIRKEGLGYTPTGATQAAVRSAGGSLGLTMFIQRFSREQETAAQPQANVTIPAEQSRPANSQANDPHVVPNTTNQGRSAAFLLGLGLTFGGDKVRSAQFTDGTSQTMTAGGIVYLKAGCDWEIHPRFSVQGSLGYHGNNVSASNGDMRFERAFLEAIGHGRLAERHRLGLGLRKSFNAKYTASGQGVSMGVTKATFNGKVGPLLEYEYLAKHGVKGWGFSVRYVVDKYDTDKVYGNSHLFANDLNGSHIGLGCTWYL